MNVELEPLKPWPIVRKIKMRSWLWGVFWGAVVAHFVTLYFMLKESVR